MNVLKRIDTAHQLVIEPFIDWVEDRCRSNDTFKIPRFLVGPNAYNYVLWHVATIFDHTRSLRNALEELIEQCNPGGLAVKEVVLSVAGPGQNNRPFQSSTHLDDVARRTHLILRGKGQLDNGSSSIDYQRGDLFEVPREQFGAEHCTANIIAAYATHLVCFWVDPAVSQKPIWDLFAEHNQISVDQLRKRSK